MRLILIIVSFERRKERRRKIKVNWRRGKRGDEDGMEKKKGRRERERGWRKGKEGERKDGWKREKKGERVSLRMKIDKGGK